MNYQEARLYLDELSKYGSVLGLESMRELLKRLGDPQRDLKFIHIAGTNGKGSVLAYLSTVLTQAGYRTGRYLSPHLCSVRERFQVDGQLISREDFVRHLTAAAAVAEACSAPPESAIEAAAFALMPTLGMVCDPIGGYVEVPCVSRNGMFAVHSLLAATMALAGVRCIVPFDDVVAAMRDIGRRMPAALRETALGGLAQTPCGLKFPPKPVAVQPACNLKKKSSPFPERP